MFVIYFYVEGGVCCQILLNGLQNVMWYLFMPLDILIVNPANLVFISSNVDKNVLVKTGIIITNQVSTSTLLHLDFMDFSV